MKVLITGAGGFVAAHLVDFLRADEPDVEIFGTARPQTTISRGPSADITSVEADLNDPAAAERVMDEVKPDRIVHLAGQSSVHRSWIEPGATLRVNVLGLVNLLDAVRQRRLRPDVLVVGSAEEYGMVDPREIPLKETTPLRPSSPYAVSKVAQAALAGLYGPAGDMKVVLTRTFPHTGPGRGETFAESSFARQIAEIEAGLKPPVLNVGNLEAVRDYTDVRDVVRAYWALLESGRPGEAYNVCSGRGRRMKEMLDILLSHSQAQVEVKLDPKRLRPSDVPVLVGDPRKLRDDTGWEPTRPLENTLGDLLEDWRRRVAPAT